MQSTDGDIAVELDASAVAKYKKHGFSYNGFGYGIAWAERLSRELGGALQAEIVTTAIGSMRESGFPHRGCGLAWANRAVLMLTLP